MAEKEEIIFDLVTGKDELNPSLNKAKKTSGDIEDSTSGISKGFALVGGTVSKAFSVLFSVPSAIAGIAAAVGFKEIIDVSVAQENAVNRLNNQLLITGEYTKSVSKDLQDFANAMEDTTKFGDDVVLNQLAVAQAIGATASQSKQIVKAAADLSVALGVDLGTATEQLSKTLNGAVGTLGKLDPSLKKLTKSQLESGEAIRILGERFKGLAEGELTSFSGVTTQLTNKFEDFFKAIGKIIIENPTLLAGLREIGKVFEGLIDTIKKNENQIKDFVTNGVLFLVDAFEFSARAIATTLRVFSLLIDILNSIKSAVISASVSVLEFASTFTPLAGLISGIVSSISFAISGLVQLASAISGVARDSEFMQKALKKAGIDIDFRGIGNQLDEIDVKLKSIIDKDPKELSGDLAKSLESFNNKSNKVIDNFETSITDVAKSVDGIADGANKIGDNLRKVSSKPLNIKIPKIRADKFDLEEFSRKFGEQFKEFMATALGKTLQSFTTNLAQGAVGAKNFVVDVISTGLDALLPGIGQVAKPIIDVLAQGPEKTKQMVESFVRAIPGIIQNVAAALPVLVTTLITEIANQADEIIIALANAMPVVAVALAEQAPNIALALAKAMPDVAVAFLKAMIPGANIISDKLSLGGDGFLSKVKESGSSFFQKVYEGAVSFFEKVFHIARHFFEVIIDSGKQFIENVVSGAGRFVEELVKKIGEKLTTGVGGVVTGGGVLAPVTNFVGGIGKKLGFAEGGQGFVKSVPSGFSNDSFPAFLTSGELVVDRSTAQDLRSFLNNQNNNQNMDLTNALLAKLLTAIQQPVQVETNVVVGQDSIANVILNLTRSNQRLA